jgi:hypothetical protein
MKETNFHPTPRAGRIQRLLTALLALSFLVTALGGATASAQDAAPAANPDSAAQFFPFITSNTWRTDLGDRVGFNAVAGDIASYGDIRTLNAGWYNDWRVDPSPNRLNGIEYVQTIRVHMKLACGDFYQYDRTTCPYATPHTYVFTPNEATIRLAAKLNVGSLWVIGNEIDRKDWCEELSGNSCVKSGGQDEMLPEVYARAYHDLRAIVKDADPTALIANGGIIQPTPLRLTYLTKIWDTYQSLYGSPMPVDVWNIHNFILHEQPGFGADIPPGSTATVGKYTAANLTPARYLDKKFFIEQLIEMRKWMQARGQQDKPLVITEYGPLYTTPDDQQTIEDFMTWSFELLLGLPVNDTNTNNTSGAKKTRGLSDTYGMPADGNRLVQRWLWFALDNGNRYNPHSSLYTEGVNTLYPTGEQFRTWVTTNLGSLQYSWPR